MSKTEWSPQTQETVAFGAAAALVAAVVYCVAQNWDYIKAGFEGPRPVELADLDKARQVSDLPTPFVRLVARSGVLKTD